MAKPLGAIEIPTASDLSEAALSDAMEMLIEIKVKNKDFADSSDREFFSSYKHIRIASQNMGPAVALRLHGDFYIDISFTYSEDEWSLHEKTWNKKTKQYDEIIIWSPGA